MRVCLCCCFSVYLVSDIVYLNAMEDADWIEDSKQGTHGLSRSVLTNRIIISKLIVHSKL